MNRIKEVLSQQGISQTDLAKHSLHDNNNK